MKHIILVVILLFLFSCSPPNKQAPLAKDGIIDLRGWDFTHQTKINLEGYWKFAWMEDSPQYSAREFPDSNWETIYVPKEWSRRTGSSYGYGWLRLTILLDKTKKLGLYIPSTLTAYKLYLNGEIIAEQGNPGNTPETFSPRRLPVNVEIPVEERIVLAWKISNFVHIKGGPEKSPVIGKIESLRFSEWRRNIIRAFFLGLFFMAGFYQFILYSLRKKETANLYLAVIYLLLFLRTLGTEFILTRFLHFFNQHAIFYFNYSIEYFTITGLTLFYSLYTYNLYPKYFNDKILKGIIICCLVSSLLFFIPSIRLINFRIFQIFMMILIVILFVITMRAFKDKAEDIWYSLAGTGIVVAAALYDTIVSLLGLNLTANLIIYGFIIHIISHTIILFNRFSRAMQESEYLTKNLKKEVQIRTAELSEMNEQKTRFFINIAHEIKTPLTFINNYLDKYIKHHPENNDILIVKQNLDKMQKDMLDILIAEKLERGKSFYNHKQRVNASLLLKSKIVFLEKVSGHLSPKQSDSNEVGDHLSPKQSDSNEVGDHLSPKQSDSNEVGDRNSFVLQTDIQKGIFITIDPNALNQIFNNLIENTVKYLGSGNKIFISLKKRGSGGEFIIVDNGQGIDPNQINNIFKPYYQASHKKQSLQGIGMGLSIVKMIVDEVNGSINIESTLGEGTKVSVLFPGARDALEAGVDEKDITPPLINRSLIPLKETIYDKNKPSLFIVEDNRDLIGFLQDSLMDKYNIFYAFDGTEALKKLKGSPLPDLIISDIMMEEMNGYEFLDRILETEKYKDIPFLYLTAKTEKNDKLKGLSKGAIDFISKPFLIEELLAKTDSIIKNRNYHTEQTIREMEKKLWGVFRAEKGYPFEESIKKYGINPKEKDVILCLKEGLEYKEIAVKLNLSLSSIKKRIFAIYRKCGVQNKVELLDLLFR